MSVAAMTMDDQRPLMNSKPYEPNMHAGGSGPASPTPSEPSAIPTTTVHHHQSHHHHHHHHTQFHHRHQNTSASSSMSAAADIVAEATIAEQRQRMLEDEIENLKAEQSRLTQQYVDAQKKEKILMRRLANKEQEFQDYVTQIAEYKAAQAPSALALRSALLDPAVNLLFEKLKKELKATKAKLEETQNELSAWKFTPDSNTGKRLMAKCRLLYQENEELGKMTSNGRLAKLETELAMQKSFSEEVKKSQSELDDFLQELDEDVEGMQSTILFLQQELKTTRDRIQVLEQENFQYKNGVVSLKSGDNKDAESVTLGDENVDMKMVVNGGNSEIKVSNQNSEMLKYQTPLATIDENECINAKVPTEYYNGCAVEPEPKAEETTENVQETAAARLARKRNYEAETSPTEVTTNNNEQHNPTVTAPATLANTHTPRTLPPKKSKLRVMPARRASVQSLEENNVMTPEATATTTATPLGLIVDNAACMANEEQTPSMMMTIGEDSSSNSANLQNENSTSATAPQRIMTRRRSVRQQQMNGDSNH